jgi:quercetin dioxygenase-like cupin family protein
MNGRLTMPENLVSAARARRTETPNAVMTTLASPSQGPTAGLSLWLAEMRSGQQGPLHVFDTEQVWHLLGGAAEITVGGAPVKLEPGDTVVLPAGAERQVRTDSGARFVVCGHGEAVVRVPGEAESRGTPPWIG